MKAENHLRSTGRSTQQMLDAAQGAIFVVPNDARGCMEYHCNLARRHGRSDLHLISPEDLERPEKLFGRRISGIAIDHAANLTRWQQAGLERLAVLVVQPGETS